PISEIMPLIHWHQGLEKLVSVNDVTQSWAYLPTHGIVKHDRYHFSELPKVAKLTPQNLKKLQEHAALFWNNHAEIDAGQEKKCVLQIMTTKYKNDESWLSANYTSTVLPEHATFRIIDTDGNVSSFGLQLEKEEFEALKGFFSTYKTGKAFLSSPDFEEPIGFLTKRITSIPLTQVRLQRLIDYVRAKNQSGINFSHLHTNCAFVVREILEIAGCRTRPPTSSLTQGFGRLLPYPFDGIVATVCSVVSAIFSFVTYVAPPLGYFLEKVVTVLTNLFVIMPLGGTATTDDANTNSSNTGLLPPLIGSVSDLFDD